MCGRRERRRPSCDGGAAGDRPEIPGVLPRALSGEGFRRRRITCRFAGSQGRLRYL